ARAAPPTRRIARHARRTDQRYTVGAVTTWHSGRRGWQRRAAAWPPAIVKQSRSVPMRPTFLVGRNRSTPASQHARGGGREGAIPRAMRAALASVIVVAAAGPAAAQAIPAHASWTQLSWSNGVGAGWFDTSVRRVKGFRDHLYASGARELMYDA